MPAGSVCRLRMLLTPLDSPSFVFSSKDVLPLNMPTGDCRKIDPAKPPPAPGTEITVTAPDWDLGELQRAAEATQTFATGSGCALPMTPSTSNTTST